MTSDWTHGQIGAPVFTMKKITILDVGTEISNAYLGCISDQWILLMPKTQVFVTFNRYGRIPESSTLDQIRDILEIQNSEYSITYATGLMGITLFSFFVYVNKYGTSIRPDQTKFDVTKETENLWIKK